MKNILLFFTAFLFIHDCIAQSSQIRISRYTVPSDNSVEKVLVLKMPYGNYSIEAITGDTIAFKNAGEIMVDVICTDYPPEQSLATLNANRVKEFYKTFSFINPSQINKITCYRQTGGDEKEKALPMFHGVVIRYRALQNETTKKTDLAKLEELLTEVEKNYRYKRKPSLRGEDLPSTLYIKPEKKSITDSTGKPPYEDPSMSLKGKKITYIIGDTAYLRSKFSIPDSQPIVDFKTAYKKDLITKRVYQQFKDKPGSYITLYIPLAEEIPVEKHETVAATTDDSPPVKLPDSTIIETLKRNSWKNIAVVADVTGSMYPYNVQLLAWLQLYSVSNLSKNFVFFNDGDEKPDEKKKTGKTGGIYSRYCSSYEEVKILLKFTMQKGAGGDFPENVIEAVLAAEKYFPDAGSTVLIADNWADIRDKELMSRIRKPVKVILCAVKNHSINIDYLNLAYKTKGSLHLIDQDITDLALLQEGAVLKIGKASYKIKNGLFIELEIAGGPGITL
jgi:hypothetical protein